MQNRSYNLASLNNNKDVFNIVDILAESSNKLLQAEIEARQPDAIEVLHHFAIMKHLLKTVDNFHFPNKFYTMNANKRRTPSSKARFLLNNIAVAVNRLPRQYRSLTEDSNSCSFFYELADMASVYAENKYFPPYIEENLCKQALSLLNLFIDLVTDSVGDNISLRDLYTLSDKDQATCKRIRFKSNSIGFQFFNLYKDLNHLDNTIKLLELSEQIDTSIDGNRAKYQLLSIVTKIGENLSPRSLSDRVRLYLSSDINIEDITLPRNAILHREKDLTNSLDMVVMGDDAIFIGIQNDFGKIKKSISQAITHIRIATATLENTAPPDEYAPIGTFYNSKYTKPKSYLVECKTLQDFNQQFPHLSNHITDSQKNDLLTSFRLMNNSVITAVTDVIQDDVYKSLKASRLPKTQSKKVISDLTSLINQDPITLRFLVELRNKIPLKDYLGLDKQRLVLDQLENFNNQLKLSIQMLHSKTTKMTGIELFDRRIAFDDYAVTDFPDQLIGMLGLNGEYIELSNFVKDSSPQFEPVRGNNMVLLPLTKDERKHIYEDVDAGRPAGLNLQNRMMTEQMFYRLLEISRRVDFAKRLQSYCGFVEMANSLEIYKKSLLHSELMFSCMEKLSEEVRPQRLANQVRKTFKEFRNYLSHNGNLGDLLNIQTHEQTTFRFIMEASAIFEDNIFPAMRLQLAKDEIVGKWVSFVKTQRLESGYAHRLDRKESSKLESYTSHADRFPKESRVAQLTPKIIGNMLSR